MARRIDCRLGALAALAFFLSAAAAAQPGRDADPVESIQREARAVRPLVEHDATRKFLDASADLPRPGPRVIYYNRVTRDALTEGEALERDVARIEREGYERTELSERYFYYTRYGSPIAYARALDLAVAHGVKTFDGAKILDFGYGGIGHLRMLASLGAHAVGVDVDPVLDALYSTDPADTGVIPRADVADDGPNGSLGVHSGQFPKDRTLASAIGDGYSLVISKNVLKRGYIHPDREPASPNMLIDLGVDDAAFLRGVRNALAPGGLLVIYNLYPKQSGPDEPYKPWADGRCPFDKDELEAEGFEVIEYNRDDTEAARMMGARLGWGAQMNFAEDLFGMYTIARRRE